MTESTSGTVAGDHFVAMMKCECHGFAVHPAAWDMRLCPGCAQVRRAERYAAAFATEVEAFVTALRLEKGP